MKVGKPFQHGVKVAQAAGWALDMTRKGHLRLRPPKPVTWPGGRLVTQIIFPGSASDVRSAKNFEADLRRSGLDV